MRRGDLKSSTLLQPKCPCCRPRSQAALQAGRRDGTRAVGRQLSLRCIGGRLLFAANDRELTRVCRFLSALRGTQSRCVRKLNRSGFDAGFMVETSLAGTSGVERSRCSYSSGDVVELAVQPAVVPVDHTVCARGERPARLRTSCPITASPLPAATCADALPRLTVDKWSQVQIL